MNKAFFDFLLRWPKGYIFGVDLEYNLDKSAASRHSIIKRTIKEGFLAPLRRDLFLIRKLKKAVLNAFELAPIIYGPSYVSFESSLSYHGWIPEAVITTTCASAKRSKDFETALGVFSYEHIPIDAFPIGVEQHKQKEGTVLFIASPLKALADLIYARKRTWKNLEELAEDLRIDPDNVRSADRNLLEELIENYPSQRVKKTLNNLLKELSK